MSPSLEKPARVADGRVDAVDFVIRSAPVDVAHTNDVLECPELPAFERGSEALVGIAHFAFFFHFRSHIAVDAEHTVGAAVFVAEDDVG